MLHRPTALTCRVSTSRWTPTLACALALCLSVTPGHVAAGNGDLDGRIENVERLIETSTGAGRVQTSQVAAALEKHTEARRLLGRARATHNTGDAEGARSLLDQATRAMFEAVRLAGPPAAVQQKSTEDFDDRRRSVEALTEALGRIGQEKSKNSETRVLIDDVNTMVARAQTRRDAGETDAGRALLDEAYDKAKRGIERMRGGETLVRSLHFDNKEEEYLYEVDRNDTHRMLLDVLAKDGRSAASAMVSKFVNKAVALREQAEREAAGGDHATAVTTLERSTRELIRAIRSSGVYIPG